MSQFPSLVFNPNPNARFVRLRRIYKYQAMAEHIETLGWVRPRGGMTAFPWLLSSEDTKPFCQAAAEHGVLLVPGDCYGMPSHFRLGFARAPPDTFSKALDRLRRDLQKLVTENGFGIDEQAAIPIEKQRLSKGATMAKYVIQSKRGEPPQGAYSQGWRAGDFIFIPGTGSIDPATGKIVGDTVEQQTEKTIDNIAAVLKAGGASLKDVVKVTAHLSDPSLFRRYDVVYARRFSRPYPVRTTLAAILVRPRT